MCKVNKHRAEVCVCAKRCPDRPADPFACGTDNLVHRSECHLNRTACHTRRPLAPRPCAHPQIGAMRPCDGEPARAQVSDVYRAYLHEGRRDAVLYCNVVGNPQPAVQWFHQGRPVRSTDPRYRATSNKLVLVNSTNSSPLPLYMYSVRRTPTPPKETTSS